MTRSASPRALLRAPILAIAAFLPCLVATGAPGARADEPVEVELLLAVDCSSSVSSGEFELQMKGIAAAFRDPEVVAAIETTAPRGIAVSLMQWSSKSNQVQSVDWTHVRDAESAAAFADEVLAAPRAVGGGATAIGSAIAYGTRLIGENDFRGERRAIDVSGDGVTNQGVSTADSRDLAVAVGISVNGLAVTQRDRNLGLYYSRFVVGGPNAFLVTAGHYRDFAKAMLRKLVIEITGPPVAHLPAIEPPSASRPRLAAN